MYEIIVGRNETDRKLLGNAGTIPLGKHYVTMEREKSLSNPILLDVNKPHIILVSGKRGSGKSYSLGVMTEGISKLPLDIKQNISTLIFDTMGIYWTMKFPNYRDDALLAEWDLEPKTLSPKIFVPFGKFQEYKDKGIPVDESFGIQPVEVSSSQWCDIFGIELLSSRGILIERSVKYSKEKFKKLSMDNIIESIQKDRDSSEEDKKVVTARFEAVKNWGLFDEKASEFSELIKGGETVVLDLSAYSEEEGSSIIKALTVGYICSKALQVRIRARKEEEIKLIKEGAFLGKSVIKKTAPLLWIFIDEAHEFLPKEGKTLATLPLIEILREGRQPGISLVLATQQPGKIHTDVMAQSDIVLSHRLTARADVDALNEIMHSYLPFQIQKYIDGLPSVKGSAIILDDTSEKIYPMGVQPRVSWHGGQDPALIRKKVEKALLEDLKI